MKLLCGSAAVLVVLLSYAGAAQQVTAKNTVATQPSEMTPAQQRIDGAKRQVALDPKKIQAYNDLAIAYLRRARETADLKFRDMAETVVSQGLALDAKDFPMQKTQVALLLAQHRYVEAKEKATALNLRTPDDVSLYGYLAEADIAMGNYPEAEKSTQWMLNMLSNNVPGLLLGARLRVLYGDAEGALELLNLAYTETSPTEVEDLAWIGNQMASVEIDAGKAEAAAAMLARAEQDFPKYPYTMENLARVRMAEGRAAAAVGLLQAAAHLYGDPHILFELAGAEIAAGQVDAARASYVKFVAAAGTSSSQGEATDDLILFEAGDTKTAAAALTLAQTEMKVRHDVWTLDSYAWALYANGRYPEADATIQKAIAVGVRSAQIFDHAGHIAAKLHKEGDAAKYFELAVAANPVSVFATDARSAGGVSAGKVTATGSQTPVSVAATATANGEVTRVSLPDPASGVAAFSPVSEALLVPKPTDTERVIRGAQARVAKNAKDAVGFASLGAAYFQRARETGNVDDYQLAEQALTKSLDLDSSDFAADAALGSMAEVCMGEHRFADALVYAQKALALGSGDVSPFAIVGDAYADMGEYDKAAAAYGRLTPREMTLSPRAAYARDSRLSYLKFVKGDTEGAIGLMKTAVAEGAETQLPSENLAWLYYELGEYLTQAGDAAGADKAYVGALTIHPGDYRALAGLGKLRANRGSYAEAITLYQRAIAIVPMPLFVAELGDLYGKTGKAAEAKKQYQLVEYMGLLGSINQVLHNRDLAIFYADHDMKAAEGLKLAHKEFEVRHDIYTWDALAWALYKDGKTAEAAKASEKALQFGTRDSLLLFHAGMIADTLGQRDLARSDLKQALQINPHFHVLYANAAQQKLASMEARADLGSSADHHGR